MTQTDSSPTSAAHKANIRRASMAGKPAKKSAKAGLRTDRILSPFVETEASGINSLALRRLRAERQRLLDDIQHQQVPRQDRPTSASHLADEATEVEEQITALALRNNLEELLKEVDHALARAEHGTYGVCQRCGQSISPERLEALPSTDWCITCAQVRTHSKVTR